MVAQVRGETQWPEASAIVERSEKCVPNKIRAVVPLPHRAACDALVDVAHALGYSGTDEYNGSCLKRPAQVRRRLKRLK